MKEEDNLSTPGITHERHAWRARFISRFNRLKSQLAKHWWVLLATAATGLAAETLIARCENPQFVSCGRMIVNLKLSIPEGSLYTEELNNFLGTQAALMQSGLVLNRAHSRVMSALGSQDSAPVALKVLIL